MSVTLPSSFATTTSAGLDVRGKDGNKSLGKRKLQLEEEVERSHNMLRKDRKRRKKMEGIQIQVIRSLAAAADAT